MLIIDVGMAWALALIVVWRSVEKQAAHCPGLFSSLVLAMLTLTTIVLLLAGLASGLARRSWWEIGALTLLACGLLQGVDFWIGDWRDQVGLPGDKHPFAPLTVGWLLVGVYVTYALAFLYSRWRLPTGPHSDR